MNDQEWSQGSGFFVVLSACMCVVGWMVAPQKIGLCPNLQGLSRIRSHWRMDPCSCSKKGSCNEIILDDWWTLNTRTNVFVRERRMLCENGVDFVLGAMGEGMPGAPRGWKRQRRVSPSPCPRPPPPAPAKPLESILPTPHFGISGIQICEGIYCCCLKPLSFCWLFTTAVVKKNKKTVS